MGCKGNRNWSDEEQQHFCINNNTNIFKYIYIIRIQQNNHSFYMHFLCQQIQQKQKTSKNITHHCPEQGRPLRNQTCSTSMFFFATAHLPHQWTATPLACLAVPPLGPKPNMPCPTCQPKNTTVNMCNCERSTVSGYNSCPCKTSSS